MSRTKKTDAWVASVRISIPITATDPQSIARAQESVARLATLIPGSTVEITHAGFGRMAAPNPVPAQTILPGVTYDVKDGVVAGIAPAPTDEPEIPASLRRVPRPAPNGPSPMDPSGDGSFRGPDGAS